MTNFHDLAIARRSIRRYTPEPVDSEQVKLILEAALLAPTSKNTRAWQFVAVDDPDTLKRLSECKERFAHPIAGAALAIVVAVDVTADHCWIEDAALAAGYMMLQAEDLGLGSVWIQVRDSYMADGTPAQEVVQEIVGLPEHICPVCVVAIGHKDEQRRPQNTEKLKWENVHIGRYQTPAVAE